MAYPSDKELTQLATLKSWLSVGDSNSDALLTQLIAAVGGAFLRYTGRVALVSRAVTETRNGSEGLQQRMVMRARPIVSVQSVSVDGAAIPASASPTAAGFAWDSSVLYLRGPHTFSPGWQNVVVGLTAGWAPASAELLALEQACIATCAMWWKRRKDLGKASETASGIGGVTFQARDLPREAKLILGTFRTRVPVAG